MYSSWNNPNNKYKRHNPNNNMMRYDSNENLVNDKSNDNVMWHKSNTNSLYNKSYNLSYDKQTNGSQYNKSNNKKVISIVVGIAISIGVICIVCANTIKENDIEKSIVDSSQLINNNSDSDDIWIVDDQLGVGNSSIASVENSVGTTNSEEVLSENATEGINITGAASTTEQTVATAAPTEISRPIATSAPTPVPTYIPTQTSSPVVTSTPTYVPSPMYTPSPTVAPIVTPQPTATPRPVVTYPQLVTNYTSKDSNGQIIYILANSDSRYYSESELQSLTSEQLRFARNEVFARKGGMFNSSDLNQYFRSRSWYSPYRMAEGFEDEDLNVYEIANVKLIQSVERSRM